MRTRFLCLFVAFAGWLSAQNPIQYELVIKTPGVTADQAYNKVELWLINSFNNPDKVVQLKDSQSKKMVVKASTPFRSVKRNAGDINGRIDYVLNLFFRDGRMKMEMVSMSHVGGSASSSFGVLTDAEIPDIKIPFATKKWKSEIYTEMKDAAKLEWNTLFRLIGAAANDKTAAEEDDW